MSVGVRVTIDLPMNKEKERGMPGLEESGAVHWFWDELSCDIRQE